MGELSATDLATLLLPASSSGDATDSLSDDESDDNDEDSSFSYDTEEDEVQMQDEKLKLSIKGIRKIVTFFSRSPRKTETLIAEAGKLNIKYLELVLDCKTRWDSLLACLERFEYLYGAVQRALKEWNRSLLLKDVNLELIKKVIKVLKPIRDVVKILSNNNTTLFEADVALEELLNTLAENTSMIGQKLFQSVSFRIKERRNQNFASLSWYIERPELYPPDNTYLKYCTKASLHKLTFNLIKRLYDEDACTNTVEPSEDMVSVEPKTFNERYMAALVSPKAMKANNPKTFDLKSIQRDFEKYESSNKEAKPKTIWRIEKICKAIRPSSTEPERVFSTAGKFVTKLRNKLSDAAIQALVFLKFHFARKQPDAEKVEIKR